MIKNAPFITFEGIDFSGKTTQINLLRDKLMYSGQKVEILRDPGGTKISEKIRNILLDPDHQEMDDRTEVLLYEAARSQLVSEKIIPLLQQGCFVLIDRFYDSTTAYQGFGRGLSIPFIHSLNRFASHDLAPTLTFFIDIPMDEFSARRQKNSQDRLESNTIDFFITIRNGYLQIASTESERIHVIDGTKGIDEIHQKIWEIVQKQFEI